MTQRGPQSSLRGIAYMVLALLLLTLADAATKWLGDTLPVWQIVCLRAVFIFIPVGILVARTGGLASLRVHDRRGLALRVFYYIGSTTLIATSMILLPLADAATLLFAGPLFVTALAPIMLGEHIGWRRWVAVLVGFVGVVIMMRPTPEAMQPLALVPILAALFSTFRDIVTRRISATESTNAIMVWSTLGLVIAGLATIPFGWVAVGWVDLALLALAGILGGIAHILMVEAFRVAEAALVSPFKYSAVIWAVALGYFIWGTVPDQFILVGGSFVIASGLYILHRETRRKKS
ncbi:MAG: DMT family transporter [Proteobacteria bacterium]|nr:DMT family transporter [Pseudomonadota bacterium]